MPPWLLLWSDYSAIIRNPSSKCTSGGTPLPDKKFSNAVTAKLSEDAPEGVFTLRTLSPTCSKIRSVSRFCEGFIKPRTKSLNGGELTSPIFTELVWLHEGNVRPRHGPDRPTDHDAILSQRLFQRGTEPDCRFGNGNLKVFIGFSQR